MDKDELIIRTSDYNDPSNRYIQMDLVKPGTDLSFEWTRALELLDKYTFPGIKKRHDDALMRMANTKRMFSNDVPKSAPFVKESDSAYYKSWVKEVMTPYLSLVTSKTLLDLEQQQVGKKGSYRTIDGPQLSANIATPAVYQAGGGFDAPSITDEELNDVIDYIVDWLSKHNDVKEHSVRPQTKEDYIDGLPSSTSRGLLHQQGGKEMPVIIDGEERVWPTDKIIKEVLIPLGPNHPVNRAGVDVFVMDTGARIQDSGWEYESTITYTGSGQVFELPKELGVKKPAKYRKINYLNAAVAASAGTLLTLQKDWKRYMPYAPTAGTDEDLYERFKSWSNNSEEWLALVMDWEEFDLRIVPQLLRAKNRLYRRLFIKNHHRTIDDLDYFQIDNKAFINFRGSGNSVSYLIESIIGSWGSGYPDTFQGGTIINLIMLLSITKRMLGSYPDLLDFILAGDDMVLRLLKTLLGDMTVPDFVDQFIVLAKSMFGASMHPDKLFYSDKDPHAVHILQLLFTSDVNTENYEINTDMLDRDDMEKFVESFGSIREPDFINGFYPIGRNSNIAVRERGTPESPAAGDLRTLTRLFNHVRCVEMTSPDHFEGSYLHYGLLLGIKFHLSRANALVSLIQRYPVNDNSWFDILAKAAGGKSVLDMLTDSGYSQPYDYEDFRNSYIIRMYKWVADRWIKPVDYNNWEEFAQAVLSSEFVEEGTTFSDLTIG